MLSSKEDHYGFRSSSTTKMSKLKTADRTLASFHWKLLVCGQPLPVLANISSKHQHTQDPSAAENCIVGPLSVAWIHYLGQLHIYCMFCCCLAHQQPIVCMPKLLSYLHLPISSQLTYESLCCPLRRLNREEKQQYRWTFIMISGCTIKLTNPTSFPCLVKNTQ
jgi:hypothetical protein